MRGRHQLKSAIGIAALAWSSQGMAQAPAENAPPESVGLEAIIVTAERRAADAQKSAVAISVVTGDQLARKGIANSRDILDSIPGLDLTQSAPNANLSLRGLGAGGGAQYTDPVISFNYGGVPITKAYATTASMYDVERVELLKGPQGTLYGRNATVGALNVIPNRPVDHFEGAASVSVGNYDAFNTTGMLNLPVTDGLATRFAFASNKHDGYLSNGYNDADDIAGRASILYKPNSDFSLLLWADYFRNDSNGPSTIFRYVTPGQEFQVPGNPWFAWGPAGSCSDPAFCPSWGDSGTQFHPGGDLAGIGAADPVLEGLSVTGDDGYLKVKQQIYAAELTYHFSDMVFTFIPAHVITDVDFHTYQAALDFRNFTHSKQTSLEARLASDYDNDFRWIVGAFYLNDDTLARQDNLEVGGYQILRTPNLTAEGFGIFGEVTVPLTDFLRVTGGLRYNHDEKSQDGFTLLDAFTPGQFTAANCRAAQGATVVDGPVTAFGNYYPFGYCSVPNSGNVKDKSLNWKAAVEADIGPASLLYANVRTGYKVGGLAPGLPPNTYKPEKLTAYEIGSKNRFFNNRLQANLELFYWDYKDQQISLLRQINPAGQSSYPVNVPGYVYGAELALDAYISESDRLNIDLLYSKGKYDVYPTVISTGGQIGGLTDYPRVNLPKWNGTVSYSHSFELASAAKVLFNASSHFESKTNLRPVPVNVPGDLRDAFIKFDASLTYVEPEERWQVMLFVKNITDKAVIGSGTSGTVGNGIFYRSPTNIPDMRYAAIEAPRTYGVTVSAKF